MNKISLALLLLLAGVATAQADDRRSSDRHDRDRQSDRRGDDRWDRDRDHDRDRDWDRDRDRDRDWDRDRDRDRDWDRDRRDRDDCDRRDRGRWDRHDHRSDRSDRRFHRALDLARFAIEVINDRQYRSYECGCRHEWRSGRHEWRNDRGRRDRHWVPGHYAPVRSCSHHRH